MLLSDHLFINDRFIQIPESLQNVSYEVELGVIIGKHCKNTSVDEAVDCIGGICLGLDLTAFHELVKKMHLILSSFD